MALSARVASSASAVTMYCDLCAHVCVCACVSLRACESRRVHACVCESMHQAVLGRHIQLRDAAMLWREQVRGRRSNAMNPENAMPCMLFAHAKPQP